MDIDNHIPIANYIFVTITAGVLAYVTAMSENVDETDEMPPEYADNQEDSDISDDIQPADDENKNENENENESDNNNSFVSSFGAATTGFFAGLGATNKEEKEEEKEEKEESTADDIPSLDTKQLEDGSEIQPSQDSPDISELKDSELGQPPIEQQGTVKSESIAELDSNVKDNDDSLNVIKKEPINGGTKSTRRRTKSKKLNKSKRTTN